ncbi:MAG: AI-2E family transporter [Pirellulales bacterium]
MYPQDWQRSIVVATSVLVTVVVLGVLYWAQAVFIPLTLAILLTLILAPPVAAIQRLGVGRVPAVVLVVTLVTGLVIGVGWLVTRQFVQLAYDLPTYSDTIKARVRSLKTMATGPSTGRIGKLIDEVTAEIERPVSAGHSRAAAESEAARAAAEAQHAAPAAAAPAPPPLVQPVVVQGETPAWLSPVTAALGSAGEALAMFALAIVLTVFMLITRERLRDRLILLVGHGRLTKTTKAVDEVVHLISRLLLMQVIVNGTYGMALGAGLLLLGVKYALLWGLLAAILRYIPYVGPWIAAVPPVLLSLAMSDGWTTPLLVIGWIVLIELVSNNVVEPLLYGRSMGVSAVALLVSAAIWAFLWGTVGLVLSSPLTVCLVVLGKYVPRLKFLDILLGDEPALQPHETFYQRLLARDVHEARQIALEQAAAGQAGQEQTRATQPQQVFDTLLVPALSYLKRDLAANLVTEADEEFIIQAVREILAEVKSQASAAADVASEAAGGEQPAEALERVQMLACPAEGDCDVLAVEMLCELLDPLRWKVDIVSEDMLATELIDSVARDNIPVVCIGGLAPEGVAHARYLCKRLRSYRDDVKIIVGRWGAGHVNESLARQLREAGANEVEWSLHDASKRLLSWWSMLVAHPSAPDGATAAPGRNEPAVRAASERAGAV